MTITRVLRTPSFHLVWLIPLLAGLWQVHALRALDAGNCNGDYAVDVELPNGGRWQLCWEQRPLDGIVLYDIAYTTPDGFRSMVLAETSVAQIHVPYDDNSARFHDVTDDGLGGSNLADLSAAECPDGRLLADNGKNVLCRQVTHRGQAFYGRARGQRYSLDLFSVSTSGEYNYIPEWRFYDDGTIEPWMGATGKLQRYGLNPAYGWPVRSTNVIAISHIHNYYWRLDFDLGANGDDDLVEELAWTAAGQTGERHLSQVRLETETGRTIQPQTMRIWRIVDGALRNDDDRAISYVIDPAMLGQRDVGPSYEPWTEQDIYFTRYRACERYTSHNPRIDGCGDDVTDFTDGESLVDADLVVWYGVTFHHLPRDEDEIYMDTHWDGFQIRPHDWTATNELVENLLPFARFSAQPVTPTTPLDIAFDATASNDDDGQLVAYAWDLGDGSSATGPTFVHAYPRPGSYPVALTVTDDKGGASRTLQTVVATSPCALGDVDCGGGSDAVDALFVLQHDVGLRQASRTVPPPVGSLFLPACDVDDDNVCSVIDALQLLQCSTLIVNPFCPSESSRWTDDLPAQVYPVDVQTLLLQPTAAGAAALVAEASELAAVSLEVAFDREQYTVTGCWADPDRLADSALCVVDEPSGRVRINFLAGAGVSGSVVLAHLVYGPLTAVAPAELTLTTTGAVTAGLTRAPVVYRLQALAPLYLPLIGRE